MRALASAGDVRSGQPQQRRGPDRAFRFVDEDPRDGRVLLTQFEAAAGFEHGDRLTPSCERLMSHPSARQGRKGRRAAGDSARCSTLSSREEPVPDEPAEVRCTICDATDDCDHLVAWFDDSNARCERGHASERVDEFSEVIRTTFWGLITGRRVPSMPWNDPNLRECWDSARENLADAKCPDDLWVDGYAEIRLIKVLLEACGAEEFPGEYPELDGGPGMDVAYSVFFASDPRQCVDEALQRLQDLIASSRSSHAARLDGGARRRPRTTRQ